MPKTLTTNELTVLGRVEILCDALEKDYENDSIRLHESSLRDEMHYSPYHEKALAEIENGTANLNKFKSYEGRKYHKIIMRTACNADRNNDQKSVHAFVDRKTGEVYKPASWKGPAKHVRYDLRKIRDRQLLEVKCDWSGGYLYKV